TCIFTGWPELLRPSGSGATPPARVASPRSSTAPVPMSETKDLRFITTTPGSCGTVVGTDSSQVFEDRPPTARRHELRVGGGRELVPNFGTVRSHVVSTEDRFRARARCHH